MAPVGWGPAPSHEPAPGLWEPTPETATHRRGRLIVTGVVVAVAVLVVAGVVGRSQRSPTEQIIANAGQQLAADPAFKQRYGDLSSGDEAFRTGQTIAARGLSRLTDEQLLQYFSSSDHMIGALDTRTCGAIFGGTISSSDTAALAKALGTLPTDEVQRYTDVVVAAIKADLHDDPAPRPAPDPAAAASAYSDLLAGAGPDGPRLTKLASSLASASPDDQCWFGKTILHDSLALPEPQRSTILLTFLTANG